MARRFFPAMNKLITAAILTVSVSVFAKGSHTDAVSADTVLASTAKIQVTRADLDAEIARIPEKDRTEFLADRTRLATVVENILVNKTLAQEARARNLDKDPEVQQEIENQTMKVLAKYRARDFWKSAPSVDMTPMARQEYLLNKEKYTLPAQYRIWHTLIRTEKTNWAEGYKRAEKVLAEAKSGVDLAQIAKKYSDDPTAAQNGGMNQVVPLANIQPDIASKLPTLKVGELGPVIDTAQGFFVFKLVEIIPEVRLSFDQIKADLLEEVRAKYLTSLFDAHVSSIRADASLKVNVEALDAIRPDINRLLEEAQKTSPSAPKK